MIILKFPEADNVQSSVMATKSKKPNIEEIKVKMSKILEEYFQPSLTERYVELIAKTINDGISFPDNGIYQIGNDGELIKFYETEGLWNSTGFKISDYVINSDSKFWENFNNEHCFLTKKLELIKAEINRITEDMFFTGESVAVASIELKKYKMHKLSDTGIVDILAKAFKKKIAIEIAQELNDVFLYKKKNGIILLKNGFTKYVVYKNSVKKFDYKEYAESIKYVLEQNMMREDADQMAIMIKNQLLFGVSATLEIKKRKGKELHLSYNGIDIIYFEGYYAAKCTEELFEEITSKTLEIANSKYSYPSKRFSGIIYYKDTYSVPEEEMKIDISNLDIFTLTYSIFLSKIKVKILHQFEDAIIYHLKEDAENPEGPDRSIIGKYIVIEKRHKSFGDD